MNQNSVRVAERHWKKWGSSQGRENEGASQLNNRTDENQFAGKLIKCLNVFY